MKVIEGLTIEKCENYYVDSYKETKIIAITKMLKNYVSNNVVDEFLNYVENYKRDYINDELSTSNYERMNFIFVRIINSLVKHVDFSYDLENSEWNDIKNWFKNFVADEKHLNLILNINMNTGDDESLILFTRLLEKISSKNSTFKQNLFIQFINWVDRNIQNFYNKKYFQNVIYLVEVIFPNKLCKENFEFLLKINEKVLILFENSIQLGEEVHGNRLPYFSFLLKSLIHQRKKLIINFFKDTSFKKNLLSIFQLDYLKIRYLGLDFFKLLKSQLDIMDDEIEKKEFIEKSQIMQILDLVIIPGLDKFSEMFINSLKISLVGETTECNLTALGIKSIEKKFFANNLQATIDISGQLFDNCYKEIFQDIEYLKMGFLGQTEKIVGIAKVYGDKPFTFASSRIFVQNFKKNCLKNENKIELDKQF